MVKNFCLKTQVLGIIFTKVGASFYFLRKCPPNLPIWTASFSRACWIGLHSTPPPSSGLFFHKLWVFLSVPAWWWRWFGDTDWSLLKWQLLTHAMVKAGKGEIVLGVTRSPALVSQAYVTVTWMCQTVSQQNLQWVGSGDICWSML